MRGLIKIHKALWGKTLEIRNLNIIYFLHYVKFCFIIVPAKCKHCKITLENKTNDTHSKEHEYY